MNIVFYILIFLISMITSYLFLSIFLYRIERLVSKSFSKFKENIFKKENGNE